MRRLLLALALLTASLVVAPAAGAAEHGHEGHEGHGTQEAPAVRPAPAPTRPAPPAPPADPDRRMSAASAGPLAPFLAGARPGARVVIPPGTYRGTVVLDVAVHLEARDGAVLEGTGTGSTVTITAPGTTVTGLHVVGSGTGPAESPAGIRIEADDVEVRGTVVEDAYVGIGVFGASRVRLVENRVDGRSSARLGDDSHAATAKDTAEVADRRPRGDGISLWDAHGVLVRDNVVRHARDGIYVSFGSDLLIDRNEVHRSRYGLHTMYAGALQLVENRFESNLSGAVVMYGGPALLLRNHVERSTSPSTGFGVIIKDVVGAEVIQNVIVDNRVGVQLDGPGKGEARSRLQANTIGRNQLGAALYPSAHATFSANSFIDNTVQVAGRGGGSGRHVTWSENGWGNYWSTYRGYEGGIDGLGAVPHREGGRADDLLDRAPELAAIAGSPGLRLLRAVEAARFASEPIVVDELPLTRPVSPPLPATDRPGDPAALAVLGAFLLLAPAALLTRRVRPRLLPTMRRAFA